jgi:serine/threonine-protein kinase
MIGRILGKRYQIVEKVAMGGMSNVYKALDMNLKRYDAIKILKEEFAQNTEFLEQFRQEANSVAGLNHPNIVNIYNVGSEQGLQYIVMEYIKGRTLKKIIKEKGRLFQDQVINYSEQIAKGLQHAHINGIIHRDIKPHNILITDDDRVKIFDFGIAKHSESSTMTNSGRIIGSVHYFSPEQARGLTTDLRSDIYSLGIVMYEMVTGRLPFDSESPVTIALKHMQEPVIPPITINSSISEKLNAVIMKAVAKDPIDRYQSMDDMLTDIQRVKGAGPLVYAIADGNGEVPTKATMDSTQVMSPVRTTGPVTAKAKFDGMPPDGDDEFEYDEIIEEEQREKRRNRGLLALLVGLVILLTGVSVYAVNYFNNLNDSRQEQNDQKTMSMINIVGMSEAKARLELSKFQIKLEPEYITSETPGGFVLESSPNAGEEVQTGGTVKAKVSKTREIVKVPDFSNMNLEQARAAIIGSDLVEGKVDDVYHDYILEGIVITSDPLSGRELEKGSTVNLTISKGKDPNKEDLVVPDILGLEPSLASETLMAAKLKLGSTTYVMVEDKDFDGKVVRQSLPMGTRVTLDTVINVEIGKYEETSAPESTTTPDSKPEVTKPEDTKPEDTKPEDTKPEDTKPEDTKPEATKPDTKPATKPVTTTTPGTKPPATGKVTAKDLVEKDYYEAEEIALKAGYTISILNLHNPDGSVVPTAKKNELMDQGKINAVVKEVDISNKRILVNALSNVPYNE